MGSRQLAFQYKSTDLKMRLLRVLSMFVVLAQGLAFPAILNRIFGLTENQPQPQPRSTYVTLADESDGDHCQVALQAGTNKTIAGKYWFMRTGDSVSNHHINCITDESSTTTKLAVLESRKENDCLTRYLTDRYGGDSGTEQYAIGLRAPNYRNVWEWWNIDSNDNVDISTPTFTNWAPSYPQGDGDCVVIVIGKDDATNGMWQNVACGGGENYYGICEKHSSGKWPL